MLNLWRIVILICVLGCTVLAVFWWFAYKNDLDLSRIRETPTYRVKIKTETPWEAGTNGMIKWNEWDSVLVVSGPGSFLSAVVSRKGGTPNLQDRTTVKIVMDNKEIAMKSFEVARAMGLTQQNYSGVVWLPGEYNKTNAPDQGAEKQNIETMVLGYSQPLYFHDLLIVGVHVASVVDDIGDDLVKKIFVQATYTKEYTGDDETTGGGDKENPYP